MCCFLKEEMSDDPNGGPWVLSSRKNARQIEKINSCLQVSAFIMCDGTLEFLNKGLMMDF